MSEAPDLMGYVRGLVEKAGLGNMPKDFKEDYIAKLAVEAQQRLGIMAVDELVVEDMEAFETLVGADPGPNPEEMSAFFESRIPDFQEKVKASLQVFADEFLQGAAKMKGRKLTE